MIVTYWKLDQKPRRSRSAISRQIGRARPIFAAEAEALDHPRDDQDRRRQAARRWHRSARRAISSEPTHISDDRQRQPRLAALAVGINAHQPGADRPHDEADREDRRGVAAAARSGRPWERRPARNRARRRNRRTSRTIRRDCRPSRRRCCVKRLRSARAAASGTGLARPLGGAAAVDRVEHQPDHLRADEEQLGAVAAG